MTDTPIHLVGNLVDDPELRFTPSGAAVANFRIASTPRRFDRASGGWVDGETMFLTCSVWREQAEHAAESLQRGMRVIAVGKLRSRTYETSQGEKRTVFEIDAAEVGPSLRYAEAKVTKQQRSPSSQGSYDTARPAVRDREPGGTRRRRSDGDPWTVQSGAGDPRDPWNPGGSFTSPDQSDEPPF